MSDILAALPTFFSDAPARLELLLQGGPVILLIAALSVLTVALILWKIWRLALIGAWTGGRRAERAVRLWESGDAAAAERLLVGRRTCRAEVVLTAMRSLRDPALSAEAAEAETVRVAKGVLARLRSGLRPLELIATVAPLLGLLGTVLGMIAAFQALQEAGSRADPATLAGGIWEALLTTAAGMAVAIPASAALTWFEAVADRLRHEMEDLATRLRIRAPEAASAPLRHAAE
ncbi:flagellar motor protein MotA [Roseivivax halodurans JCM 10272]|uniref:Flagellar motor protein MotA n=1 Tax=Roseivivax halodurans JCM 10272 TaxID=1449350 RepID=X7EBY8_9RHOB|nr:MotA/TolQ/ExbB proton channel family protein [Roseivivax halodurans]ETX13427.1 flagellar motor protein MotA [Roseivivax halodurans JCM 10272]